MRLRFERCFSHHQAPQLIMSCIFTAIRSICMEAISPWTLTRACAMILIKLIRLQSFTAQKLKFSVKDFFSKFDQICRKLQIWSHLLRKSSMKSFIFSAVFYWCKSNELQKFRKLESRGGIR